MASKYDQPNEPDLDRYETKPDAELPEDFGEPDPFFGGPHDPPVDPAEQAAQSAFDALTTLGSEIGSATDINRVMALRNVMRLVWQRATAVCDLAAARCDEDMERRR